MAREAGSCVTSMTNQHYFLIYTFISCFQVQYSALISLLQDYWDLYYVRIQMAN